MLGPLSPAFHGFRLTAPPSGRVCCFAPSRTYLLDGLNRHLDLVSPARYILDRRGRYVGSVRFQHAATVGAQAGDLIRVEGFHCGVRRKWRALVGRALFHAPIC